MEKFMANCVFNLRNVRPVVRRQPNYQLAVRDGEQVRGNDQAAARLTGDSE